MSFQSEQLKLENNSGSALRKRDKWTNVVQARILHILDLHTADAVYYHKACSVSQRGLHHSI